MSHEHDDPELRMLKLRWTPTTPMFRRRWHVLEFLLLILLICVPAAAMAFGLSDVLIVEAVIFALAGGIGVLLLRGDWRLFGPLFYFDTVRLARRGRSINMRILYVSVLLIGQGFVYSSFFQHYQPLDRLLFASGPALSRNQMVEFAASFVGSVILIQNLAVLLLTPAYAATAITEERERRTLEMMFTSHLSDREIVIGKLSSRLMHIGGVLLAGLPVLAMSQFLGGVDLVDLLSNFALTGMNLLLAGSLCMMISANCRKSLTAVFVSYAAMAALFGCGFGCVMVWREASGTRGELFPLEFRGFLMLGEAIFAVVCLAVAVGSLRSLPETESFLRPAEYGEAGSSPELPAARRQEIAVEERVVLRPMSRVLPPIGANPLLWKEMNQGGPIIAFSPAFWVPVGSVLMPFFLVFLSMFLTSLTGVVDIHQNLPVLELLKWVLLLLAALYCLGVAYRASTSVVGERQNGTLDALLTLPVERADILRAKWLGAIAKGWGWSLFFVPILLMELSGGIHWLGAIGLPAVIVVQAALLASVGLFLSLVSPTVLAAQSRMILLVLFVLSVFIVDNLLGDQGWIGRANEFVNPLSAWAFLTTSWPDIQAMPRNVLIYRWSAVLVNMAFCAATAFLYWHLACKRFEKFAT